MADDRKRVFLLVSPQEHAAIMEEVNLFHKWPMMGRGIKYVSARYDNRNRRYYTYEFDTHTITSVNRYEMIDGLPVPQDVRLFDEIMHWLRSGRTTKRGSRKIIGGSETPLRAVDPLVDGRSGASIAREGTPAFEFLEGNPTSVGWGWITLHENEDGSIGFVHSNAPGTVHPISHVPTFLMQINALSGIVD